MDKELLINHINTKHTNLVHSMVRCLDYDFNKIDNSFDLHTDRLLYRYNNSDNHVVTWSDILQVILKVSDSIKDCINNLLNKKLKTFEFDELKRDKFFTGIKAKDIYDCLISAIELSYFHNSNIVNRVLVKLKNTIKTLGKETNLKPNSRVDRYNFYKLRSDMLVLRLYEMIYE